MKSIILAGFLLLFGAGAVWGQITIESGAMLYLQSGATVYSDGGSVTNAGTIAGKGTLQISNGSFTNSGTLEITIGPTASTHTTINCQNGTFTPGGNFTVTMDSYTPSQNDEATIVDAGALANSFFSNQSSNGWYGAYNFPSGSDNFSIRYGDANVWTGSAFDHDWFNPANWSLGMVPTSSQDAVLTGAFLINVSSGSAVANTITTLNTTTGFGLFVEAGASLTASSTTLGNDGFLYGFGTINGDVNCRYLGAVHPNYGMGNNTVGTLTINGNLTMTGTNCVIYAKITGASTYSKITVSGTATVDNAGLQIVENYGPINGQEFLLLESSTLAGPFTSTFPPTYAVTYDDPGMGDVTATYITPPPANDNCSGAQSMTVNNGYNGSTVSATQAVSPSPSCHDSGQYDLWYSFSAPASGMVIIKNINNSINAVVLYSGSCGSLNPITCVEVSNNGGSVCPQLFVTGLTPSSTYYIQVVTDSPVDFNFYFEEPSGNPANDFCSGAIPATVGAQNACPTGQVSGTTVNAIHDLPVTCDNNNYQCNYLDVWYSFTAPSTGSVKFSPITGSPVASIYSGSCGSLNLEACMMGEATASLTAGNTYYLKIATYDNSGIGKAFTFCLEEAPAAPANNICDNAISTSVSPNGACSFVSGTTESATLSKPFACQFSNGEVDADVWYSFTAPAGGAVTFHSGTGNPFASIYASCAEGTPITAGCMRGSGTVAGLIGGNTYFLQVMTQASGGSDFTFCLEELGAAPSNNACSNAIQAELGNPLVVNSLYALTNSLPPCAAQPTLNAPDLWYTFTASSNTIAYELMQGTLPLTIYSGSCGNLSLVTCAIPFSPVPTNLVPGTTYYAQINSLGAEANGSSTISSPGDYTFTGAADDFFDNPSNWRSGEVPSPSNNITIPSGVTCELDMDFTPTGNILVEDGGRLSIQSGVTLNINNGSLTNQGIIGGDGTIMGDFINPLEGELAPGTSPGCLNFSNNLTNQGTISIELNGKTTACTDYDKITVIGTADIGGSTLVVTVGGSYTPTNGDKITFLEATSISGTFASASLPANWTVKYDVPGTVYLEFENLLPVELVSFRANKKGSNVQLDWQTASEQNNEGFDIERSSDAKTWQWLAFKPGHGSTLEKQSYSYTDQQPLSATNFYRLRQKDFDGIFEYSPIVSVEIERDGGGIKLFPNPATASVSCILENGLAGMATLTLYNLTGKMVKAQTLLLDGNTLRIDVALDGLPGGMYIFKFQAGAKDWQKRLVIE